MDVVRFGKIVRMLRRHRSWRQIDLAERCRCSQSLIARIERGGAGRVTVDTLEGILATLGARLVLRVDWNGEAADRLLDADHASLVEQVQSILRGAGWEAIAEVTFSIGGERGSIDVLAWHVPTRTVLVVEVKSVVADVQGTLAPFDRKVRLAGRIASDQGWRPDRIASMLVIGDDSTARRRIRQHSETFLARFPQRGREVRRFIALPDQSPAVRGLWFLPPRTGANSRHRVAGPRPAA